MTIYAAILAGGVGARLWPRSRQSNPKQFADITGSGETMIQATVGRMGDLVTPDQVYVLTGQRYQQLVVEQLPAVPTANAIAEPSGRNTAPAIGLACMHLAHRDPDAIIVILPADHVIVDAAGFQQAIKRAVAAAEIGNLVTLGIQANYPHTGYGYIQRGDLLMDAGADDLPVYSVRRFCEKPDLATAEAFLDSGDYFWNGGIFVSRVDRMLAEMERQMPEVFALLQEIGAALDTPDAAAVLARAWSAMPSVSIDYGVMENAKHVAVVPLRAGWNDVGSWDALESVLRPDEAGNLMAKTDAIAVDSFNNIVYCENKLVALVGVDDLVVVDTGDAILIGHRKQMQKVRTVVDTLRETGRTDLL